MKKVLSIVAAGLISIGLSGIAQANLLTNEGFDEDIGLTGTAWGVYEFIPGWTKGIGTAGIEVQHGSIVPADSFAQYVELDSHWGVDTNSSMFQSIFLPEGSYQLDWMYHARTNNGGDDNGIKAYVTDSVGSEIYKTEISKKASDQTGLWEQISGIFTITNAGNYNLWFAAFGNDNSLGGFIDSASLTAVPEPASIFLLGAGLAGVAGLRRKKE